MKSNLLVELTDERMVYLKRLLKDVVLPRGAHIFAPNIAVDLSVLDGEDTSAIVCGKCAPGLQNAAKERGVDVYNMMTNEKFLAVNSRLTAEGALMMLLQKCAVSIAESRVLIMGFGRTGAAVARLLNRLDVDVSIATNSSSRPAFAFSSNVLPLADFDFSSYDAVINTVPHPIVRDDALNTFKRGAVYVDLASTPAVNLDYAKYLGVDADIYPALPAKVCPYSAAVAMKDYILEVIT